MGKKALFELKYAGVKNDPIPILYHTEGDFSSILRISNNITQFNGNPELYKEFHRIFSDILKLLGEGYTIQKQDIFCRTNYIIKEETDFLQQKFEEHFQGRPYNGVHTFLTITKNITRSNFFVFDQKEFDSFVRKTEKVMAILTEHGFAPKLLDEEEIDLYTKRYLAQEFDKETFSVKNFRVNDNDISFSDKTLKIISLVDVDETNFPTVIRPFHIINKGRDFPADILSFLHTVPSCDNIVYNQVIRIPDQRKSITALELKKRRHSSMPDPANMVSVEDIDNVLGLIQRTNDLIVQCHFDILLFGDYDAITPAENYIESNLARIGIIPSNNAYNQYELFVNSFPGHTRNLNDKYDLFQTTAMPALCLLYKESPPRDENGTFKLKLTDREGIPINIDTNDQPMSTGRISNRNKFVLGPSGSGKSFFMNTYCQQSHYQGADVVIVDTGGSYSGLCAYLGGRYIEYTDEQPITMNPFHFTIEEYNEEKRSFLKSLIALLWKGAGGSIDPVEDSVISDLIRLYYLSYFAGEQTVRASFNSFYEFSVAKIKEITKKNTISKHIDSNGFIYVLKQFYKGGQFDSILNRESDASLFDESFIVFEIDNIKDNPILFPITTLIIMDVFLQKMRIKKGRKSLIIEEAWKAIASPMMADYIKFVYKTVRKWNGEAILVTQDLEDIIGNEIVQNSVINNSDTVILLDQSKFAKNYDAIAEILNLNKIEQSKIFTINQLDNKDGRSGFKEVYLQRGDTGEVLGVEVALEQYFIFTTERAEKDAVKIYHTVYGNYIEAINNFVRDFRESGLGKAQFCKKVNNGPKALLKKIS